MDEDHFSIVLVLALLWDLLLGDPQNRFHPVAWMGNAIALARRSVPVSGPRNCFLYGLMLVLFGSMVVGGVGWSVQQVCSRCPVWISVLLQVMVLKCTFSVSSLAKAAKQVSIALCNGDIDAARRHVSYHLVSRDVSQLGASKLAAATIESVAENTSDSVIAPLFYFAIAGLPGALVYRFVNTCDAMIGYRTVEFEWFGKVAARTDDLLNLIPSRITAALMLCVGSYEAGTIRRAIAIWSRDHRLTASPNAGHPMSAAAGVLGVVLEKEEHYVLGAGLANPSYANIDQVIRLLWATTIAGGMFLIGMVVLWGRIQSR